jgi:membrane protease YdiL (CAAX protease family)
MKPSSCLDRRSRSIYVSMIAHVTVNIVFLLMLTVSFTAG